MAENIGTLIIAAILIFLIYLGLIALLKAILPQSDLRAFILSPSGKVLMAFVSCIIFCIAFVYVLINFSGIQC
ncbi:hypothetical protein [Mucilaginibacter terrae]|uniref:Uncharacterized protein n=1 Tax=Mucilaginibacter terrae TaxID=1955052 RepID=A0ABU3GW64_9SPHI|nr:hypothetical protein [Mucilaginibacter terrae]MDT3404009.1 hypothetical protein [Mucilaginibacter terrae]